MARKRLITRSIKSIECECLCLDTKENETFNMTVNISGDFKNGTDMLMRAKELTETEDVILCTILKTKEVVKRYWLEEDEFIKVANIFPEKEKKEKEEVE